jgi:UDP-N-acetylmuramate--alanine ligase
MEESMVGVPSCQQAVELPADLRCGRVAGKYFHLIGIGGSGMSGLARLLAADGAVVSGSDLVEGPGVRLLQKRGLPVAIGHHADHLPDKIDAVVLSAAVPEDNVEYQAALRRGIPVLWYPQMLGALMRQRTGVAVAGTHGKSTTTAMTALVLARAGLRPSFIVGAEVPQLGGSSGIGDGPHFVVEACEYRRNFLHLTPQSAAILNVESDHLDFFKTPDSVVSAFAAFAGRLPADGLLVVPYGDPVTDAVCRGVAARTETFGLGASADWRAEGIVAQRGLHQFDLWHGGSRLGRVEMRVPGRHNVANALATAALAHVCGASADAICRALSEFAGADRRLTLRGRVRDVVVVDDYAHHPTEVAATLRAGRDYYQPHRLWVVFQPHQHSRTRFLLADFARSFDLADVVIVPDIYFVRDSEQERQRVCAQDLVQRLRTNGREALHLPRFDQIVEYLAGHVGEGDLVLTMGAGDVWKVADELVGRLGEHRPGERPA